MTCYKRHKEAFCEAATKKRREEEDATGGTRAPSATETALGDLGEGVGRGGAGEEEEEGYRIHADQLDRMCESKQLQEWLRDPRIREVVTLVDADPADREKALDGAIGTNKDFADFVDALCDVINPQGAPT